MWYLFTRCRGKRTILIKPEEILRDIAKLDTDKPIRRYEITEKQLETHMKALVLDGYIDYSLSEAKEGKVFVVTLSTRGEAFQRERDEIVKRRWRSLGWKVLLTFVAFGISALLWSLIGL